MTACFTYRVAPSLALLLGAAASLAGCIDPSSIGIETQGESSGSAESGSEGEGSGATSQGQTSDPTAGETDGTTSDPTSGETENPGCPPIDIGPCEDCTCGDDGNWVCENICASTCEGLACGTSCLRCPDDDPDCGIPAFEGVCTADEQCVGVPPPKLGFCEGALQPGFEDELDVVSGCSDIVVFARDMADERGLVIQVDQDLYTQAMDSGMPVHVEVPATDPTVVLEARAGFYVTALECSDVIVNEPDIDESWRPTAGMLIIDVVPVGPNFAEATVELVDVELHRLQPGPAPIVVSTTFAGVGVGPVPG